MDDVLSVGDLVFHDVFIFLVVGVVVEHLVGAVQIGDDQVDDLLVPTTPRVDHSGVVISVVFNTLFHRCQSELLLFIVTVTTHLHSDRADQAGVQHLKLVVTVV